jgi:hypothetical protein
MIALTQLLDCWVQGQTLEVWQAKLRTRQKGRRRTIDIKIGDGGC